MQISYSLGLAAAQPRADGDSGPVPQTHLFVVAGQSNASGRAPDDAGAGFPSGTLEYGAGNAWAPVGVRLYHGPWEASVATSSNFGFARQFAIDHAAANPGVTLGFIGVAHGGTGFVNNDWNKGNPSYNQAIARINAALAVAPEGAVLKGILWHQGENDGATTESRAAYEAALTTFIPNFRGDITGGSAVPFVLGGFAFGLTNYNAITHSVVQAIPNVLTLTGYAPADVPRNATGADAIHFDALSMRRLGARYAEALPQAAVNTSLGGAGTITTGTLARGTLPATASATVTDVALGTPAAGRLVVVGVQARHSSNSPRPLGVSLAGVGLARVSAPNVTGSRNGTTLFYGVIPEGTTGTLEVTWASAPNASFAGYFVLPVYGARPHLANPRAFNLIGGDTAYGTTIATSLDVTAGDLIVAISGANLPTAPTGSFDLAFSDSAALGTNAAMAVGHAVASASGTRTVTCNWGATAVNFPTLTVMALRAS